MLTNIKALDKLNILLRNKEQDIATKLKSNGAALETSNTVTHIGVFIKLEAVL